MILNYSPSGHLLPMTTTNQIQLYLHHKSVQSVVSAGDMALDKGSAVEVSLSKVQLTF